MLSAQPPSTVVVLQVCRRGLMGPKSNADTLHSSRHHSGAPSSRPPHNEKKLNRPCRRLKSGNVSTGRFERWQHMEICVQSGWWTGYFLRIERRSDETVSSRGRSGPAASRLQNGLSRNPGSFVMYLELRHSRSFEFMGSWWPPVA